MNNKIIQQAKDRLNYLKNLQKPNGIIMKKVKVDINDALVRRIVAANNVTRKG